MEISSLLFSLGLFSAGIWLIFTINGDFKEKRRQGQRTAGVPRPTPHLARHAARNAQGRAIGNARQLSASKPVSAPRATPNDVEKRGVTDQFEGLNAAFLRETFEKFKREL